MVDTPGFGDFVNNDDSWRPIVENIEQRFDAYLDAENKVLYTEQVPEIGQEPNYDAALAKLG